MVERVRDGNWKKRKKREGERRERKRERDLREEE